MIHSVACSLNGYLTDARHDCTREVPGDEVITVLTADVAAISSCLYGRRR
ncbi:hypothetical protein [Kocuria sabuli]